MTEAPTATFPVQSGFEVLDEEFLTPAKIAELSQKSERTIDWWRETHQGPPYVRLGKSIFYRKSAFLKWLLDQEVMPRRSRKAVGR